MLEAANQYQKQSNNFNLPIWLGLFTEGIYTVFPKNESYDTLVPSTGTDPQFNSCLVNELGNRVSGCTSVPETNMPKSTRSYLLHTEKEQYSWISGCREQNLPL